MAKFKFKLDALKKYREHKLLVAKRDLALIGSHMQELRDRKARSESDRREMLGGSNSLMYVSIVASETERIRNLEKELVRVEAEFERHRDWVTHLNRELRAVEKLEENQKADFELEQKQVEKRTADDWVTQRWPLIKAGRGL